MKGIRRYFSYMGEDGVWYWTILIITLIVESLLQILYSYVNKQVLSAVEYQDMKLFKMAVAVCMLIVLLKCFFPYLRYLEIKLVRKMVFALKLRLFHKLMRLDMEYFDKSKTGDVLKTLNWDANSLKDSWFSHVYWVLGKVVLVTSSIITMYIYSPILTVISLMISTMTAAVSVRINAVMKSRVKNVQKSTSNLASQLSEILSGFMTLKMYEGSCVVWKHYKDENEKVTRQERERVRVAAVLEMTAFILGILGSFGTMIAGTFFVSKGVMDYGTVMAVVTLQMGVGNAMQRFGASLTAFTTSFVRAGNVFDFLELKCEEDWSAKQVQVDWSKKPVTVHNLHFAYDRSMSDAEVPETEVVNGINLEADMNQKVMIVGESGCGKSTLLKLLMRFYQVQPGQIKIYGRDINEYSVEQLRDMITFVLQESYLFEGTIAENIAYGCRHNAAISRQDIVQAAKWAYADEFIKDMPQGYETVVTAGGSNLSGGQRQRIAIARAFLKDSPIVIMDEPSSALDVESEQMIRHSIQQFMGNKVVLMVTHRMTGIDGFDRIIRL